MVPHEAFFAIISNYLQTPWKSSLIVTHTCCLSLIHFSICLKASAISRKHHCNFCVIPIIGCKSLCNDIIPTINSVFVTAYVNAIDLCFDVESHLKVSKEIDTSSSEQWVLHYSTGTKWFCMFSQRIFTIYSKSDCCYNIFQKWFSF